LGAAVEGEKVEVGLAMRVDAFAVARCVDAFEVARCVDAFVAVARWEEARCSFVGSAIVAASTDNEVSKQWMLSPIARTPQETRNE
jgi:hypothetical protein